MKKRNVYLLGMLLLSLSAVAQKDYSPRQFVKSCKKYMGTPYKFGGNDKKGIDCSGLVYNAFSEFGISIPRVSHKQAEAFPEIKLKKARTGDLVYFKTQGSKINHTGVIVKKRGKRKVLFVHAANTGVQVDDLVSNYWQKKFVKVTRPVIP
jgi:probable lipoprotein NlpC